LGPAPAAAPVPVPALAPAGPAPGLQRTAAAELHNLAAARRLVLTLSSNVG
jgi:hypothetical protein